MKLSFAQKISLLAEYLKNVTKNVGTASKVIRNSIHHTTPDTRKDIVRLSNAFINHSIFTLNSAEIDDVDGKTVSAYNDPEEKGYSIVYSTQNYLNIRARQIPRMSYGRTGGMEEEKEEEEEEKEEEDDLEGINQRGGLFY